LALPRSEADPLRVEGDRVEYSTLTWTTVELGQVRAALDDRNIPYHIVRGRISVDTAIRPFVDAIVAELVHQR